MMPRQLVQVEAQLAIELRALALAEESALGQAASIRARLVTRLAEGQAAGYSVRALSEATCLSPKRVRVLLREAG